MDFRVLSDEHRRLNLDMEKINAYTSRYKPDTWYDVSITRKQAKKSDPMRRYYFAAVLPPLMKELGYQTSETPFFHQQLKIRHFEHHPEFLDSEGKPMITQDERGIWRNVPAVFSNGSTLDVSVKKEFVDFVVMVAAHYGLYIDDPGGE